MTKKQKQEIFDAITKIGYKETEIKLMSFLNGEEIEYEPTFMTILAWFNLWHNKGLYNGDLQSVISFIQTNTYSNPSKNTKNKPKFRPEDSKEFRTEWEKRFGPIKD